MDTILAKKTKAKPSLQYWIHMDSLKGSESTDYMEPFSDYMVLDNLPSQNQYLSQGFFTRKVTFCLFVLAPWV